MGGSEQGYRRGDDRGKRYQTRGDDRGKRYRTRGEMRRQRERIVIDKSPVSWGARAGAEMYAEHWRAACSDGDWDGPSGMPSHRRSCHFIFFIMSWPGAAAAPDFKFVRISISFLSRNVFRPSLGHDMRCNATTFHLLTAVKLNFVVGV